MAYLAKIIITAVVIINFVITVTIMLVIIMNFTMLIAMVSM